MPYSHLDSQLLKCLLSLHELEKINSVKDKLFVSNLKRFLHCLSDSLTLIGRQAALPESRPQLGKVRLCLSQVATTLSLFIGHPHVRQTMWYLGERLQWCLSELRRLLCGGATDLDRDTDSSLLCHLDMALGLVRSLVPHAPPHWQQLIDDLITQAVTLAKVAAPVDYNEITSACQKVLEESNQLTQGELPTNQRSLVSEALAASLGTLEHRVNVAVLRIFMQVFSEPSRPVKHLVCHCKSASGPTSLDPLIYELDAHTERVLLVGQFAVSCCEDERRSASMRNCLASLESVDNYLVPALSTLSLDPHCPSPQAFAHFLCDHWQDQLEILHTHLDVIIDSYALTTVVFDSVTETVEQLEKQWNDRLVEIAVKQGWLLYKHLTNTGNTDLDNSTRVRLKQAINELEAATKSGVDHPAVLKRLKLLASAVDQTSGQLSRALSTSSPSCSPSPYSQDKHTGPKITDGSIRDLPLDITFSSRSRSRSNYNQPQWLREKIMVAKKDLQPAEWHMSEVTPTQVDPDRTAFRTPVNNKNGSKRLVTPYLSRTTPRKTTLYVRTKSLILDTDTDSNVSFDTLALDITDVLDNLSTLADTLSSSRANNSNSDISGVKTPAVPAETVPSASSWMSDASVPTVISDVDTPDRLMDIKQLDDKIHQLKLVQGLSKVSDQRDTCLE